MKKNDSEVKIVVVYTIEDWRNWLKKNHLNEKKVAMVSYKKHTGKNSISHREAMEEAICFGWIDTTIKKLDEERFVRYFVRRGDNANWSKNTLKYAKALFAAGKMEPHGVLRYKHGLKKGPYDHKMPKNPRMPQELKDALNENGALNHFEEFPKSTKRTFYRWILRAKQPETRKKRIDHAVKKALNKDKDFGYWNLNDKK